MGFSICISMEKDGIFCWCVDYWVLNKVIKKDVFFLFLVDKCFDMLMGKVWFFKLDVNWVYLQVKVKDLDKEKIVFIIKYGFF